MTAPLRVPEVAELLGVSEATVARSARAGEIPHFRVGRCLRFHPDEIEAYRRGVQCPHEIPRASQDQAPPEPRRQRNVVGGVVRDGLPRPAKAPIGLVPATPQALAVQHAKEC